MLLRLAEIEGGKQTKKKEKRWVDGEDKREQRTTKESATANRLGRFAGGPGVVRETSAIHTLLF